MIKNIIFDFGDIFINLDKEATYREMAKLGVSKITPQMIQVYQEYEKGLMETSDFINYFSSSFPILNKDLIFAWNAVLLDFPENRLRFLQEIAHSEKYRLFLLSNTNAFHIVEITLREGLVLFEQFCALFEKVYLSHEIGMRKPHTEVFHHIVEAQKLSASETLFIDDSPQHVEGALEAGLKAYHLKEGEQILSLFREDLV